MFERHFLIFMDRLYQIIDRKNIFVTFIGDTKVITVKLMSNIFKKEIFPLFHIKLSKVKKIISRKNFYERKEF